MPYFSVSKSQTDLITLHNNIINSSITKDWVRQLRTILPKSTKQLDFTTDIHLHTNGPKRCPLTLISLHVPHAAWGALLDNIRNDRHLNSSPLDRTSGRDCVSESVILSTCVPFADHLCFSVDYGDHILIRTISHEDQNYCCPSGSVVAGNDSIMPPGFLPDRTWHSIVQCKILIQFVPRSDNIMTHSVDITITNQQPLIFDMIPRRFFSPSASNSKGMLYVIKFNSIITGEPHPR